MARIRVSARVPLTPVRVGASARTPSGKGCGGCLGVILGLTIVVSFFVWPTLVFRTGHDAPQECTGQYRWTGYPCNTAAVRAALRHPSHVSSVGWLVEAAWVLVLVGLAGWGLYRKHVAARAA